MANTSAPNGFQIFGRQEGGSPTAGLTTATIASNDANAIGYGDPVIPLNTGFIKVATASTVPFAGIFYGCEYYATAVGRRIWSPNWPGSGNTGVVTAYLCSDPQALFVAQTDGTAAIVFADLNANAQVVMGTPNAITGFSTSMIDHTPNTTATFPFRIVGLLSSYLPSGSINGTDDTTPFNRIIVAPNFWQRASQTGI